MKRCLLPIVVLIAACSSERAPLVADDVAIKKPMPGMRMSAGYLTLQNNTDGTLTITRVVSPQFGSVEMHESVLEDGVARMVRLDELEIGAGEKVTFEPGGKHLMLMRPVADLDSVTLEFYAGEFLLLTVNVTPGP